MKNNRNGGTSLKQVVESVKRVEVAESTRKAEEARKAVEVAKQAAESARKSEEARKAMEAAKKAAEAKAAAEAAESARKSEEARKAMEAAKKAAEEKADAEELADIVKLNQLLDAEDAYEAFYDKCIADRKVELKGLNNIAVKSMIQNIEDQILARKAEAKAEKVQDFINARTAEVQDELLDIDLDIAAMTQNLHNLLHPKKTLASNVTSKVGNAMSYLNPKSYLGLEKVSASNAPEAPKFETKNATLPAPLTESFVKSIENADNSSASSSATTVTTTTVAEEKVSYPPVGRFDMKDIPVQKESFIEAMEKSLKSKASSSSAAVVKTNVVDDGKQITYPSLGNDSKVIVSQNASENEVARSKLVQATHKAANTLQRKEEAAEAAKTYVESFSMLGKKWYSQDFKNANDSKLVADTELVAARADLEVAQSQLFLFDEAVEAAAPKTVSYPMLSTGASAPAMDSQDDDNNDNVLAASKSSISIDDL